MTPRDGNIAGENGGRPLDVAVIGSGIAGLGAAWLLSQRHRVTLYEKEPRLGGHTNTVRMTVDGREIAVDTGFIVYNELNYPNLTQLFARLGVATHASNMSFAVSLDNGALEYYGAETQSAGADLIGLFAQPRNLLRPGHWRMAADCMRFFREAPALLADHATPGPTLGEWLEAGGYRAEFIERHLLPMAAAIWSAPLRTMRDFPARSFARFFHNHGLLKLTQRPVWRTVTGGGVEYIGKILANSPATVRRGAPVRSVQPAGEAAFVHEDGGVARRFDRVVIAAHADQALAMLQAPTPQERRVLGGVAYQPNLAVLHRDPALMPRRRRVWSSWNYMGDTRQAESGRSVSVTYWMNRLQGLDPSVPLFVSLNPLRSPRPELTLAAFDYHHPIFDTAALAAQAELPSIQGVRNIWFCGSWCGYGFHEDALASGLAAAEALGVRRPWTIDVKMPSIPAVTRPAAAIRPAIEAKLGD